MKTKKLLAILLSLALLIGLVPVAGMLTTAVAAEETDPTVYEIAFDGTDTVNLGYYISRSNYTENVIDGTTKYTTVYAVSFEYYLKSDAETPFTFSHSTTAGSAALEKGRHTAVFSVTVTSASTNNTFKPSYTANSVDGTLYAWNLKVTANGEEIAFYRHDPWLCTKNSHTTATGDCSDFTTATVTSDKTLSSYPFAPNADGSVQVKTVYVDQTNGSDTEEGYDGSTAEKAFKTLYKAMTEIENSLYLEGEIILVGTYTNTDGYEMIGGSANYAAPTDSVSEAPNNYVTPVTIRGAEGKDTNVLYTGEKMYMFTSTTFDDITLQKDTSGSGSFYIHARHNAVHFASNAARKGTPYLYSGVEDLHYDAGASKAHELTVNFYMNTVWLSNKYSYTDTTDARTVPGVNYVQNIDDDSTNQVRTLYIGAQGSGNTPSKSAGTIFTDDVNITVNGGKIGYKDTGSYGIYISRLAISDAAPNDFGGNALQILFNNGTGMAKDGDAFPTATEVKACNGYLYVLHCAEGGSQLAVTDTAGEYTVADPNWVAVATDTTDETKVYRSNNGVLKVDAGTYNVSWEAAEAYTVFVDDEGDDETGDGTKNAPYATLLTAVQAINAAVTEYGVTAGFINVVDTLTVTDPCAMTTATAISDLTQMHTVPITIQGANGTESALTINDNESAYDLFLYGDVTIDNITVNTSGGTIYTNKFDFVFGPNAVVNGTPTIYLGHYNANNSRTGLQVPTEPIKLTLSAQTYTKITLGGSYNRATSYSKVAKYAGFDVVLDDASVATLHIGHIGNSGNSAGNIYTDDVNVTVNGGNISTITLGDTGTNTFPTTFVNNALQFILNNGTTLTATLPTAEAVAAMGGELYVLKGAAGVYLTATEDAGVYGVEESKIAVAKNGAAVVAVSRDGKLTVPAGIYDVTYEEAAPYTFDEENGTVTVNTDVTVDFAGMPHKAVDGALFKGYVDSEGNPAATALTAGTVLTAEYVADWNADTDGDGKGDSFNVINTQLREASADKSQALRFIVQLDKSVLENFDTVEYGTVLLPNEILFLEELALGKVYGYDVGSTTLMYKSATVQGVNIYRNGNTDIQYTAALTGIAEKSYLTAYAARGYLTYTDLNGVARTVYTDNANASGLNEVAEKLIDNFYANYDEDSNEDDIAAAVAITEAAKAAAESEIASTAVALTPDNAAAMLYGDAEDTFSANVDENGVYTTADGREIKYTANGVSSTVVREIVIDTYGENANIDDTVIAQLTDLHINYANDEDMLNEYTKYSWENRLNMNSWNLAGGEHHSIGWHEKALKYATAISDQVVITGDLIDYYSLGNMQIVERLITEPYSNALMVVGNHDIDSVVSDSGSENIPTDNYFESNNRAYYDQIQQVWNNNVYYTSKLVGKEVMVVQMDNGRDTFRVEQIKALTEDLELAREKGYTVLLFMHIPLEWESAELLYGDNLNSNGIDGRESEESAEMLALIKTNGDVIRGIFAGHVHDDIYSAIPATYVDENGVTKNTTIPQFTLRGGFVAGGNVLKITVKDVAEEDMTTKTALTMTADCTDTTTQLYRLGDVDTGLTVWETTLDLGLGEGNELEIVQFNDTHLNADNPQSYANWNACISYVQDNADYFVANGDIVDKLNADLLGFVQEQLSIYDNGMTVVGNHEWYPNNPATDANYATIQQYWKNDVYYSSTVLKDKVMLIQMDNSQELFNENQLTSLKADLATAEAKGYAVLLFVHVPLGNNLTKGTGELEYPFYSVDDTIYASTKVNFSNRTMSIHSEDENTAAVCQAIADNAGIIKGVFTGHLHSDYYTTIYSNADGTGATIPQYVNSAAKFDTGNVLKINLK